MALGNDNNPITSYEGTSISYKEEIDLQETPLGGTRPYMMRDWLTCAVSISSNILGLSGVVEVEQSMVKEGEGDSLVPNIAIPLVEGKRSTVYNCKVSGRYLILNFKGANIPDSGKLYIEILGKRG